MERIHKSWCRSQKKTNLLSNTTEKSFDRVGDYSWKMFHERIAILEKFIPQMRYRFYSSTRWCKMSHIQVHLSLHTGACTGFSGTRALAPAQSRSKPSRLLHLGVSGKSHTRSSTHWWFGSVEDRNYQSMGCDSARSCFKSRGLISVTCKNGY